MTGNPDRKATRSTSLLWGAIFALVFTFGVGCFNGSFGNYKAKVAGGSGRFALVIEADRTAIQGSHFLLDTATGDIWRMNSEDGRSGDWIRMGAGPEDAQRLDEDEDEDA